MKVFRSLRLLLGVSMFSMTGFLYWSLFHESGHGLQKRHPVETIVIQEQTGVKEYASEVKINTKLPATSNDKKDLIFRTGQVIRSCQKSNIVTRQAIMTNKARKLAYCYIPKCGCTFWKRVMRFLNKDYKGKAITSPFQIPRLESHLSWRNPDTFVLFKKYRKISDSYTSFMFVREPYSRLWSAYVDKFYLPDFWSNQKKSIIANRPPSQAKKCVSDVTFPEFLNLVLKTSEPHWDPMNRLCDPCTFKPTMIGRMESFSSDTRYILDKANLSWILEGYVHSKHTEEELTMLIQYNLKDVLKYKPYISRCITKVELFHRLWRTFQINGYLPADVPIPVLNKNTTMTEFTEVVLEQYRKRPNTPEVWRKQRKDFMLAAYKNVSTALLHSLQKKYERDFSLFNYDREPVDIFGNRDAV